MVLSFFHASTFPHSLASRLYSEQRGRKKDGDGFGQSIDDDTFIPSCMVEQLRTTIFRRRIFTHAR
jgi:hypothetical protein